MWALQTGRRKGLEVAALWKSRKEDFAVESTPLQGRGEFTQREVLDTRLTSPWNSQRKVWPKTTAQ
jgi:hypothetical protein